MPSEAQQIHLRQTETPFRSRGRPWSAVTGRVPRLSTTARTDTALEIPATPRQAQAMRAFWWDGAFASASEAVLINYLGLYAIAFGASNLQVALLASLTSLAAAAAFLPGARAVEGRQRKPIVIWSGGVISRLLLLTLAVVPFLWMGNDAVWVVIVLACGRAFFNSFALPAWTSLTSDIVPIGLRGRFLASRSMGMGVAGLIAAPAAGFLIGQFSGFAGWQLAWAASFACGAAATWCYSRIPERHLAAVPDVPRDSAPPSSILADIRADRGLQLCLVNAVIWNIALQAAGPFFNVYLVKDLNASSATVGLLAAIPSFTGLIGLAWWGRRMDRVGTRRVLLSTGLLIPLLPLAWMFVSDAWQVAFINVAGGALWAGYQLATANLAMVMAPAEKRARYAALLSTATFASQFAGPLLGAALIGWLGFKLLFLLSAAGRLAATLVLLRGDVAEHHA